MTVWFDSEEQQTERDDITRLRGEFPVGPFPPETCPKHHIALSGDLFSPYCQMCEAEYDAERDRKVSIPDAEYDYQNSLGDEE